MTNKIIAVDFDGTIVDDKYPEIGKPKLPSRRGKINVKAQKSSPWERSAPIAHGIPE